MHIRTLPSQQPRVQHQRQPHHQRKLQDKRPNRAGIHQTRRAEEVDRGGTDSHVQRFKAHNRRRNNSVIRNRLERHRRNCMTAGNHNHGNHGVKAPTRDQPKALRAERQRVVPCEQTRGKQRRQAHQHSNDDPVPARRGARAKRRRLRPNLVGHRVS